MTTARSQQVNPDVTPYYHCVSRCVRRTFLCGYDTQAQRCYEHRRGWIEARIKELSLVYCIDICAYAVMSNHYHLVVHLNRKKAEALSDMEVIERWSAHHDQPTLVRHFLTKELRSKSEYLRVQEIINQWRERLSNLSWFMKELNMDISIKANFEDKCKGHFWESRFKSQALVDKKALLAAMAYVDLNPVRAGIAETPEKSEYTSIKARLDSLTKAKPAPTCLHPFIGSSTNESTDGIPYRLMDYLDLVDWTGRQLREGKVSIDGGLPSILNRLRTEQSEWLQVCSKLERKRAVLVGRKCNIERAVHKFNRQRIVGYPLN